MKVKFIHINKKEDFKESSVDDGAIVFIKDTKEIFTHGTYYAVPNDFDINDYAKKDGTYPDLTAGTAINLEGKTEITNSYMYRPVGGNEDVEFSTASIENIKGNSIAWNQLCRNGNFLDGTNEWMINPNIGDTWSVTNGVLNLTVCYDSNEGTIGYSYLKQRKIPLVIGHIYLSVCEIKTDYKAWVSIVFGDNYRGVQLNNTNGKFEKSWSIMKCTKDASDDLRVYVTDKSEEPVTAKIKNIQLFDLTVIYGAGNEPTTLEQFEEDYERWFGKILEYEEYDEGSIRNVQCSGIKTVGFNLCNINNFTGTGDEWRKQIDINLCDYPGKLHVIADVSSGTFENEVNYPRIIFKCEDGDYNLSLLDGHIDKIIPRSRITRIYSDMFYSDSRTFTIKNLCINFSWSGKRDGDYEDYWEETQPLPITTLTGKLNGEGESITIFPDGLKRVGDIYDEIINDNGVTKAIKRVGSVDLGDLSWKWNDVSDTKLNPSFQTYSVTDIKIDSNYKLTTGKYSTVTIQEMITNATKDRCITKYGGTTHINIVDKRYTESELFTQAVKGDILYYVLSTPETYIIDDFTLPVTYRIDDFGTEQIISPENTIAPIITSKYGINAVDTLRRLPQKYISTKSDDDFLAKLGVVLGGIWEKTWNNERGIFTYSYNGDIKSDFDWYEGD